jgi:hypothetical protein
VRQARCSECDDYDVGAKAERSAVLLRVAAELEALAAMYTGLEAHLLQRQAAKYRKEAK